MAIQSILDFPPELLETIWKFFDIKTLKNFSLCSKKSNDLVAHKLYENIQVNWLMLRKSAKMLPEYYFRYTKCLSFHRRYPTFDNTNIEWNDLLQNFKFVVNSCDALKLTNISLDVHTDLSFPGWSHGVPTEDLAYLFHRFASLKMLALDSLDICIRKLVSLENLDKLTLRYCTIICCYEFHSLGIMELNLEGCGYIIDVVIDSISRMGRLKRLALNHYVGDPTFDRCILDIEMLKKLTMLESLDLSKSKLPSDTELAIVLKALKTLKVFSAPDCPLIDSVESLSVLPLLTHLTLCDMHVKDEHLASIKRLKSLRYLDGLSEIDDVGLIHICEMISLEELNLCGNYFITDEGVKHLTSLQSLKIIGICDCTDLTDSCLIYLSVLPSLNKLCVKCTRLSKMALDQMKVLKGWQYFEWWGENT